MLSMLKEYCSLCCPRSCRPAASGNHSIAHPPRRKLSIPHKYFAMFVFRPNVVADFRMPSYKIAKFIHF